jgi:hypothetical protein
VLATKRIGSTALLALCAVALATGASVTEASPVHQFNYQIKDQTSFGGFTVVFNYRGYDSTGGTLPPLTGGYLRTPAGLKIKSDFLTGRFICDVRRLADSLDPSSCRRAQFGGGTVLLDLRPYAEQLVPANIHLFLARATEPNAVASVAILAIPDTSDPNVMNNPYIRASKVVLFANFRYQPTANGLYGYKLTLPTGPLRGISYTVAEAHVRIPGLVLTKRARRCIRKRVRACVKATKRYWFTTPRCPRSRSFNFEAFLAYAGIPPITITTPVPCPRFTL